MTKLPDTNQFNYMTIGSKSLTIYNKFNGKKQRKPMQDKSISNLKKQYKSKTLTKKSAKKIKKIIWHWSNAVEITQEQYKRKKTRKRHYLVMITLTLPSAQLEDDKSMNRKYLNTFLMALRRYNSEIHYLWVAEKQKNGNIHYHIIADKYINKNWLQSRWNKILATGEYINNFEKKHKHRNPPSTHIRGQKYMTNPADYITKYVTKAETSKAINAKKWGCSDSLIQFSKIVLKFKKWYANELSYYADYFNLKVHSEAFFKCFTFNKNFHKAFKFLGLYSDLLDSLKKSYRLIYEEITIQVNYLSNGMIDSATTRNSSKQLNLQFA